jgi:sterol desaturase/sphingolipid hydroxylase (fatty acid hydroxylase superfamily)
MLPWLDRLFGTYHMPRREWPAAYGIDKPVSPSLLGQLFDPLLPEPKIKDPPPNGERVVKAN